MPNVELVSPVACFPTSATRAGNNAPSTFPSIHGEDSVSVSSLFEFSRSMQIDLAVQGGRSRV